MGGITASKAEKRNLNRQGLSSANRKDPECVGPQKVRKTETINMYIGLYRFFTYTYFGVLDGVVIFRKTNEI